MKRNYAVGLILCLAAVLVSRGIRRGPEARGPFIVTTCGRAPVRSCSACRLSRRVFRRSTTTGSQQKLWRERTRKPSSLRPAQA